MLLPVLIRSSALLPTAAHNAFVLPVATRNVYLLPLLLVIQQYIWLVCLKKKERKDEKFICCTESGFIKLVLHLFYKLITWFCIHE